RAESEPLPRERRAARAAARARGWARPSVPRARGRRGEPRGQPQVPARPRRVRARPARLPAGQRDPRRGRAALAGRRLLRRRPSVASPPRDRRPRHRPGGVAGRLPPPRGGAGRSAALPAPARAGRRADGRAAPAGRIDLHARRALAHVSRRGAVEPRRDREAGGLVRFPGMASYRAQATGREPEWLTLGQAAKYLGVAQSTIRKWSDVGRVPAFYTPGGHRRYRRSDLDLFLERSGPNARGRE